MNQEKIGKFLKKLREENNWNQGELADKMFVDRSLVCKWEKGLTIISSANLISLSKLYNVSVDEILAGERKTKKNKQLIENVSLNIYDDLNAKVKKQRSKIWILVAVVFISLFLLLLSFFVNFYSSVKVYRLSYVTDSFSALSGYFFENKERVYFYLDNDFGNNEEEIKGITLYYNIDNKRKDIYNVTHPSLIHFVDYNGYGEFVDFNRMEDFINNLYIEFELADGKKESSKIDFNLEYINKNIFTEKSDDISDKKGEDKNIDDDVMDRSELSQKVKDIHDRNLQNEEEGYYQIKKGNITYDVFVLDETITMNFRKNGMEYIFTYHAFNFDFIYLDEKHNEENKMIYSYGIRSKKCIEGNCESAPDDLKILTEIVDEILEK